MLLQLKPRTTGATFGGLKLQRIAIAIVMFCVYVYAMFIVGASTPPFRRYNPSKLLASPLAINTY